MNAFLLDLVEFLGRHFTAYFDKTRVAGGNEGVSIRVRRTVPGSELEITTDKLDPYIDFGPARWHFPEYAGDELFRRLLADLTGVFTDRIVVVSGYLGETFQGCSLFRDLSDAQIIAGFREEYPACDKAVLKKWTAPESAISLREI